MSPNSEEPRFGCFKSFLYFVELRNLNCHFKQVEQTSGGTEQLFMFVCWTIFINKVKYSEKYQSYNNRSVGGRYAPPSVKSVSSARTPCF